MKYKLIEAREEFNSILEYVTERAIGSEIHSVEKGILRRILVLGRILLELFVESTGTGYSGNMMMDQEGKAFRYSRIAFKQYLSIFGLIHIPRAHYIREGVEGLFPVDAMLNLPKGKYSYLLQDWLAGLATQGPFEHTARWIKRILGLDIPHRAVQRIHLDSDEPAAEFIESLEPPPSEEEGSILVHSADGKGIRMCKKYRNPDLAAKEDEGGKMRVACVTRSYSTLPICREAEQIMANILKDPQGKSEKDKESKRSKPRHRRTIASLKQPKCEVFSKSSKLAKARIGPATEEMVTHMDGEKVLWRWSRKHLPQWIEILDFMHLVEKLWIAAHLYYKNGDPKAKEYVRESGITILEGHVDWVIEDMEIAMTDGDLSQTKADILRRKVLGYLITNRDRMDYSSYLEKGLPISTGIIESTCGNLVKDRMQGAGMSWSPNGAEAMLKLRGFYIDDLWDEFWLFRTEREKKMLYAKYSHLSANFPNDQEISKVA